MDDGQTDGHMDQDNIKTVYSIPPTPKNTVCQGIHVINMPCQLLIFNQSDYLIQVVDTNSYTSRSGSTLFAKAGHRWVQHDQG